MTPGLLRELIESMPSRIEEVIAVNGKFTKFLYTDLIFNRRVVLVE